MVEVLFRHKAMRDQQKEMVKDVLSAVQNGGHLIASAPCGVGKTDAALSPAITHALKSGLDVFFITPKISQHRLALEVARGIMEKYSLEIGGSDIIGRRHACIHPAIAPLENDAFYPSCEKMRAGAKCQFYLNAKNTSPVSRMPALLKSIRGMVPHSHVIAESKLQEICPYEAMLKSASTARVIVADYFHLLAPGIMDIFLKKTGKTLENSIVIIDEAHNLPSRVRDYLSASLNSRVASRMEKEAHAMGFKMEFAEVFDSWAGGLQEDNGERMLSTGDFDSALTYFQEGWEGVSTKMEAHGNQFAQESGKKSSLMRFAAFLKTWYSPDEGCARILKRNGEFFSVTKRLLDPGVVTSSLNRTRSTIIMSATLHPMEMYRDVLALDPARTLMKSYGSPFPKENRMNVIVKGATTKFSKRNEEQYMRMARLIDSAQEKMGGTAAFFPSYSVLKSTLPHIKSSPQYVQTERMSPKEVSALAKGFSEKGGVLVGVQGGSLSEGQDFANGEIKNAIVVGIALEEMSLETKALIEYYGKKFGRGWEYAYMCPAVSRALQSAGRAIRKETDRAAIIFADERFAWGAYSKHLPAGEAFTVADEAEVDGMLLKFWKGK
jgi:DNA excision repair protein ERCC-2